MGNNHSSEHTKLEEFARTVALNWRALDDVKEPWQTIDLCMLAIMQNDDAFYMIKSTETREFVVRRKPELIKIVPGPEQTRRMKLWAVRADGNLLRYVHSPCEEVCTAAVKKSPHMIEYVHDQYYRLTKAMLTYAVKYDGLLLRYADVQDEALCYYAIMENPYALEFATCQPESLCIYAVQRDWSVLGFVLVQTWRICRTARIVAQDDPLVLEMCDPKYAACSVEEGNLKYRNESVGLL
jgi:ribosomal protein L24E